MKEYLQWICNTVVSAPVSLSLCSYAGGAMVWVDVRGRISRGRHHLHARSRVWQLNSTAHSAAQENCTQSNWKKRNVYIVSYDYHPSKFREGPFMSKHLKLLRKKKERKNGENRNEKRDENVWLEEIIQTWLNPAGLNTLLSTNRSPREIHSNALHRRDVWRGYWETSWN